MARKSLKATWPQAIFAFFLPVFILACLRWAIVEPFVIPSGSMFPNLHIHDHVLVKKFSYGLKVPFADKWIVKWKMPERGDIAVFKYPKQPSVYYIKRVIGLPGDKITFKEGKVSVNDQVWDYEAIEVPPGEDENYEYLKETTSPGKSHVIRYRPGSAKSTDEFNINLAAGEYFMMGDNRDESLDSRFWGALPEDLLVGRAWKIVVGCEETLPTNSMLCNPSTIKQDRVWVGIEP